MSERQLLSKKAIEKKARQEELQRGFQKTNGGKSSLELLELDEDDKVYDIYTEDQYEELVETRRAGVDFVVDDEGHGYADDGEEHLGVAEDEYDHKKRLQVSASEAADNKLGRKARKLAEASSSAPQKNSMLNYVKPGVSTAQRMHQPKSMTNDNLLDVDSLLNNIQSSSSTGHGFNSSSSSISSHNTFKPKSLLAKPVISSRGAGVGLGGLSSMQRPMMRMNGNRNANSTGRHQDNYISYDNNNHTDDNNDDYGYDHGGGGGEGDYDNDDGQGDSYQTPTEKWSQPSTAVVSPGSNGATETSESMPMNAVEETIQAPTIQKISLSKTNKKLTFVEPNKAGNANNSLRNGDGTGVFKPVLGDNALSLGLGDISGSGSGSGGNAGTGVDGTSGIGSEIRSGSGNIDSTFWLQRTTVITNPPATESAVKSEDDESVMKVVSTPVEVTEEFVNMFWLDACEANGVIYLFGKIPINEPNVPTYYVSCCVAIHGAERNLFALPRATGTFKSDGSAVRAGMADVYAEINHLLVPHIIPKQQGQALFRCKAVKRKYAFEHGEIPREETEYMKIVYSARHPAPTVEQCAQGGKHVERIFGNTSSALELFLLKRGLMGPCWLTIRHPRTVTDQLSWCKIEMGVENPKFISKMAPNSKGDSLPTPPLVSMCVSMKTVLNPSTHLHEIVAISGLIHTKVEGEKDTEIDPRHMKRFTYIRPLGLTCGPHYPPAFPHDLPQEIKKVTQGTNNGGNNNQGAVLQQLPNERALINIFFARVQQEDPDIFASHNLFGFEFDVLLSRALVNKVNEWSRVGRLRRTKVPKTISDKDITSGRILCDTYKAAKEFLRETTYSLSSLSLTQLGVDRVEVDPVDVPKYFSNSQDIIKIANHTACDAILVQRLVLKLQIVPLTKQLTNLSGNLWSRTVRGARAERIEYLLLHEFHSLKYILPEKKAFADNNPSSSSSAGGGSSSSNKKGNGFNNKSNGAGSRNAHAQSQRMMENDGDDNDNDQNDGGQHANRVGGSSRTRAKASYAGGLVLEPKKGLYDTYILLLDFNSLYPSLIQEYNLCFTTIEWTKYMGNSSASGNDSSAVGGNNGKMLKKLTNGSGDGDEDGVVGLDDDELGDGDGMTSTKSLPPLPDADSGKGILPRVIKALVERRKEVKNLLKKENDLAKRQQLDIRQKALKLTANSMYGCLGFAFSRFYARPIAALVTSMGRDALQRTVDQATNQFGLDVIYGDTDSVMINTNSTDLAHVKELGNLVKKEVNKLYKSLELDLDGIFKSMLLLKKKKYAAVVIKEDKDGIITYEKELKGLDLVRRDWCPLSKDTGKYVVDQILSGNSREDIVVAIHEYLTELSRKVRNNEIELEHFVVTKGLNKNPRDYPDTKGQPHLQVALAMLKANKPVNIGDHIPYVICKQALNPVMITATTPSPPPAVVTAGSGGSGDSVSMIENEHGNGNDGDGMMNKSGVAIIEQSPTLTSTTTTSSSVIAVNTSGKPLEATMRAHHPDDVIRNPDTLTLDFEWYLTNQILPPISRLCEPIEGTSTAALSQCLGLDTSKYNRITGSGEGDDNDDWGFTPQCKMEDSERFKDCIKLRCKCLKCHQESDFTGAYLGAQNFTGLDCSECGVKYYGRKAASDLYAYLSNRVTLLTRECMRKYYDCWFVCDDPTCHRRTMQQPMAGMKCISDCHGRLVQEYTEAQLHTQLKYLEALFDMERALKNKNQDINGGDQVLNKAKILKELPKEYKEVLRLLHIQLSNTIAGSAFNWVRPSLWTAVFGRLLPPAVSGTSGGTVSVGGR